MIPIQDLLNRIQWDPEFGNDMFVIGYHDRHRDQIVRVPFAQIELTRGNHFSFSLVDQHGSLRMIPFHRVRAVWRDDELIWQRNFD